MLEICSQKDCTGCGVCVVKCPKNAITMQEKVLGHLFPVIDQDACVDCGICLKVCPSVNNEKCNYPLECYAAWAKDIEDYKSSTSGGVASVLSRLIIEDGGIVYGCAVRNNINIEHIRVDNLGDLAFLKGSKYVQSSIIAILPKLIEDVKNGRKVLFIGTPCQVAGVNKLFREKPCNLFTVDIICHGVPSNSFLKSYIYHDLKLTDISDVRFRRPDAFSLDIYSNDKRLYSSGNLWTNRYQDLFYNTFIDGFTYRDSCFRCLYAQPERISDITIGDFWGIGKTTPVNFTGNKHGLSVLLFNNEIGKSFLPQLQRDMNIFNREVTEAIGGNDQLRHPTVYNKRIYLFRMCYRAIGIRSAYYALNIDKVLRYYIKSLINYIKK